MIVLFLSFGNIAVAQEVLVQNMPTYEVGDSVDITFPSEFGNLGISAVATAEVRKGQRQGLYTEFQVTLKLSNIEVFTGKGYWSKEISNGYLVYQGIMYRGTSTMTFPLREGAVFTNKILVSGPCAQYPGKTCMNPLMTESCYGTRRVAKGIEYICDGHPSGRIKYTVNDDLFPVEYQVLEDV